MGGGGEWLRELTGGERSGEKTFDKKNKKIKTPVVVFPPIRCLCANGLSLLLTNESVQGERDSLLFLKGVCMYDPQTIYMKISPSFESHSKAVVNIHNLHCVSKAPGSITTCGQCAMGSLCFKRCRSDYRGRSIHLVSLKSFRFENLAQLVSIARLTLLRSPGSIQLHFVNFIVFQGRKFDFVSR